MNKEEAARILPFIQALAEGKTVQIKNIYGDWETCDKPVNTQMEFRIKPDTRWYRVALFPAEPWVVSSDEEECDAEQSENFIRWLTPRIEYEV